MGKTTHHEEMTYQDIGDIIRDKRKALGGISMSEAARMCGISKTYFSRIEAGLYISPVKLDQIAEGLNIKFVQGFPIKDKPKNYPYPKEKNPK